jgi:hypothetical protein
VTEIFADESDPAARSVERVAASHYDLAQYSGGGEQELEERLHDLGYLDQ